MQAPARHPPAWVGQELGPDRTSAPSVTVSVGAGAVPSTAIPSWRWSVPEVKWGRGSQPTAAARSDARRRLAALVRTICNSLCIHTVALLCLVVLHGSVGQRERYSERGDSWMRHRCTINQYTFNSDFLPSSQTPIYRYGIPHVLFLYRCWTRR